MSLWWLSYGDANGGLGVVLVEAADLRAAVAASEARGLSPGGSVMGSEVVALAQIERFTPHANRRLSILEAEWLGQDNPLPVPSPAQLHLFAK